MKKNKTITSLLVAGLLVSGTASTVFAANGRADDTTGKTDANISFKTTGNPINPIEPVQPQPPVTPGAPLSLIYVTDAVNFGTDLEAGVKDTFAGVKGDTNEIEGATNAGKNFYMQVMDRRATVDGWNVTGKLTSNQFDAATGSTVSVEGVQLVFTEAGSVYDDSKAANANIMGHAATVDATGGQVVFSATDKNGRGIFGLTQDVTKMNLKVPTAKQAEGTLHNNITWTLAAGPAK